MLPSPTDGDLVLHWCHALCDLSLYLFSSRVQYSVWQVYITTAIPYVNGNPHIGHSLEFVQTDTIARFHKCIGDDVLLLTGSDENSLKNVRAAEKKVLPPENYSTSTQLLGEHLVNLWIYRSTFFSAVSAETHFPGVQKLWQLCEKSGDIYKKSYQRFVLCRVWAIL